MKLSPRRAEVLSVIALVLQVLFSLLALFVGSSGAINSQAIQFGGWHLLGGSLIWLVLAIQFRQRRLAEEENFDIEQYQKLKQEGKDTSVFEGKNDPGQMHLAQRRLVWVEKYLLPGFSVALAVYLLLMGIFCYRSIDDQALAMHSGRQIEVMSYLIGFGLLGFLFSQYAMGMSRQDIWRPLRAGGSYLLGNAVICAALVGIVFSANYEFAMEYVVAILMVVLGVEILFSLLLDAFRPRVKGQYNRAAFESRILGMISDPGDLLKSAGHALDYQFGFKVSDTWFYKLLSKAIFPLLAAQILVLYLLTCFALVPAGHSGVLERFGVPLNLDEPFEAGMHLKLPWPFDQVVNYPTGQIKSFDIGFDRKPPIVDAATGLIYPDMSPILWTVEHWAEEYPFYLAAPRDIRAQVTGKDASEIRNVFDMLVVGLTVQYRIDDLRQYAYSIDREFLSFSEPDRALELICNQQAVKYCANNELQNLLGQGRFDTTVRLQQMIQAEVDRHNLGLKIVSVSLESVHPPIEVAEAFARVLVAQQEKQGEILKAQGQARSILNQAKSNSEVIVARADAYRIRTGHLARAQAMRFGAQMKAFEAAGDVYCMREYLSVLDGKLPDMRKYLVLVDGAVDRIYELNLEEALRPDLFSEAFGLGQQEN